MFSCTLCRRIVTLGCCVCLLCLSGCLTTSLLRNDEPQPPTASQQPPQHKPVTLPLKAPDAPIATTPNTPTVRNIAPSGVEAPAPAQRQPATSTEPVITTDSVTPASSKVMPKDLSSASPAGAANPVEGKAVAANPYPPFDVKKSDGQTLTTY